MDAGAEAGLKLIAAFSIFLRDKEACLLLRLVSAHVSLVLSPRLLHRFRVAGDMFVLWGRGAEVSGFSKSIAADDGTLNHGDAGDGHVAHHLAWAH